VKVGADHQLGIAVTEQVRHHRDAHTSGNQVRCERMPEVMRGALRWQSSLTHSWSEDALGVVALDVMQPVALGEDRPILGGWKLRYVSGQRFSHVGR
jgi:hypothetical protein